MNNQRNNNAQVDDDGRGMQPQYHQRSRNFYRKRPGSKTKRFVELFMNIYI
jgi:hypothetical protein